jgi:acylphosphatase
MLQTISISVKGTVQGVHFRQRTMEKASELVITGEVRNLRDGSVQIKATGTKEQLDKLVQWCRQGPPKAVVSDVQVKELSFQLFDRFNIVRG